MFQSFTLRERLIKANGNADNEVMEIRKVSTRQDVIDDLQTLDRWLDSINVDTAPGSPRAKTIRNKPAEAVDACWSRDGTQKFIEKYVPGIGTTRFTAEQLRQLKATRKMPAWPQSNNQPVCVWMRTRC